MSKRETIEAAERLLIRELESGFQGVLALAAMGLVETFREHGLSKADGETSVAFCFLKAYCRMLVLTTTMPDDEAVKLFLRVLTLTRKVIAETDNAEEKRVQH